MKTRGIIFTLWTGRTDNLRKALKELCGTHGTAYLHREITFILSLLYTVRLFFFCFWSEVRMKV